MKKVFFETRYSGKLPFTQIDIDTISLPKKIGICTTVQYLDYIEPIKKKLEKLGTEVKILQTKQIYDGQVLGCDVKFKPHEVEGYVFIGDGYFHPIKIAFTYNKPVFTLNINGKLKQLDNEIVTKYEKKKKGALLKFLSNNIIGVLYTTKSGQNQSFNITKILQKKYPDKTFYNFLANEINFNSLEDFPFIKAWVNTACPRIEEDFRCVNFSDILE